MAATSANDLANLLKDIPPGLWVALSSDNRVVLGFGSDMRKVLEDGKKAGEPNPILLRVPETASASNREGQRSN
jgi:hypothetical protein